MGASTLGFMSITNPTILEALAVREALALAEDLRLQRICIASDCQGIVNAIDQGTGGPPGAIIHEITERKGSFQLCNFVHEFRSSNVEAHNLAKHVLRLGIGRHVWLGNPGDLQFVPVNIVTV